MNSDNQFEKQSKLDKILDRVESTLDVGFNFLERLSDTCFDKAEAFLNRVFTKLEQYYTFLRYAAFPYSLIYPKIWQYMYHKKFDGLPTDVEGIHFLRAPVGGGKSLTSLTLAERALKLTGKSSYLTSAVEKPQKGIDEITGDVYWYVMHKVKKLDEVYVGGKRVEDWDYENYPYVHKDERHLRFNPRMNKTKDYNDAWLVEHEDELLMRHDGAKRIYKYSQHMKLDSQEMETAVYMHDIKAIKGLPVMQWLKDGLFRVYPYIIHFETYIIEYTFEGVPKRHKIKDWYLRVPIEVLNKFDTHAERRKKVKENETNV